MSHVDYLKQLLYPLGVYDLEAPYNGAELQAQGWALDAALARMEEVAREADLTTAQDWGLEQLATLVSRRPVAQETHQLRAALAALLRIGGDSFTLEAINDAIAGCGVRAKVEETEDGGTVRVSFPNVPGIPDGFAEMAAIIEDIIPAHLAVEYVYWYITWNLLEHKFSTWKALEEAALTWTQLEELVE